MNHLWKFLVPACILALLFYTLNYFGLVVAKAGVNLFGAQYSFPTRWEGKFAGTTGFYRRNFVIFRKFDTLAIELETNSGALDFEVKTPDGSSLSPTSGIYGRDTSVLIDVSQLKRCSVTLRMDHFNGQFHIALQ